MKTQAWLGDHAVLGAAILPGAAFVEVALAAAERVGAGGVEELTLVAPLVIEDEPALQVAVGEPDDDGRRPINVYSRPRNAADGEPGGGDWTLHASGLLAADAAGAGEKLDAFAAASWPPDGTEELDVEDFYDRAADAGYDYGPAFQGLHRAWRAGDSLYAEVALAEEEQGQAGEFGLHPALFDAVLHTTLVDVLDRRDADTPPEVPFAFSGVRLRQPGAVALRVRLETTRDGDADGTTVRVLAADESGTPVLAIETLETRPIDRAALRAQAGGRQDSLFTVDWVEVQDPSSDSAPLQAALIGEGEPFEDAGGVELARYPDLGALEEKIGEGAPAPQVVLAQAAAPDGPMPAAVHDAAERTLELLKAWLASEALAEARLVLLTAGALAVPEGESPNLAQAALAGLLRSARTENPERFALVDLDGSEASAGRLGDALAGDEPELALRDGTLFAPRLARVRVEEQEEAASPDPDGTILITGGTGGLGALVARHLAEEHGARHLVLTSRRGAAAEGAKELVTALGELGCEARVAACDVAEREQLEAAIAEIPDEHPLTAVIHAAGVLDDGVIDSLDGERLRRAMVPKVDGALNLHELTADRELAQFVLFSSAASTLGNPGQGNYAAANAFLDALAHQRRAEGRPATALAWGAWELATGMTAGTSEADRARLRRFGIAELSDEQGLELLDTARAAARPLFVAARLDTAALRAQAKGGTLPAIMRGLFRVRQASASQGSLARRLASAPESDWDAIVLELVRDHVASVLGHSSAEAIDPERAFKELGFDSLSAVELRNRLGQATGLKLPTTIVFDHPNPAAVAAYLRSQVEGVERAAPVARRSAARTDEPIAIVGMSCRFPGGVDSPEELWELVAEGKDAVGEFPTDRGWDLERLFDPDPDHPGTIYTRHGGFLYDAGEFDAEFFSISPREALALDPQHRLALEGAWEALEDAGIDPAGLKRSQTGVFTGIMYSDYGSAGMPAELEGYLGTGASLLSGRLSYTFGLEGPSVSVDTACSSSLVALHLACQALRNGECELALAGGVTVMSTPTGFIQFSRQRGLSPDGRCKAFGADADGVGWSEGVGLLVLERLSEARANGHDVLAVVRGSAVNQDGASNGLTAPNGPSQERVIREALASAGLSPGDVDAVEGHGTGTTLGDPIEAQALLATYGRERADGPLRLGSIKSNLGHTQAAAGVAGVIKMVEAMRHGVLPRSLHCEEPSPHVDWSVGEIELLSEPAEWPAGERPRRAGISSFGISGTNSHVILEEPPRLDAAPAEDGAAPRARRGGALPFTISAATGPALGVQAGRLASFLEGSPEIEPYEVSCALALRHAHLPHRAVAVAAHTSELVASLRALERGEPADGAVQGVISGDGPVAFLFTGQGSQWPSMGIDLYQEFPVFAEALDEVCAELDRYLERPLREVMFAPEDLDAAALLMDTRFTQVALFALEIALYRLAQSFGLAPDYLMGHSIGEFAAAHVAGVFSLEDGCRLVAERARLMGALPAGGAMLAVQASEDEIRESLAGFEDRLALAAVNGPAAAVVSGEEEAVAEIEALWRERDRRTTRLQVSHAFHSQLMEPMLDELKDVAQSIELSEPAIPIVSNVTGEQLTADQARSPEYWVRHVRGTVRFGDGVGFLRAAGVTRFLELGPDHTLSTIAAQAVDVEDEHELLFASSLRGQKVPQRLAFLAFLGAAHCHGAGIDWRALLDDRGAGRVKLPTYAFQRERYWLDSARGPGDLAAAGQQPAEHPLLGAAVRLAVDEGWVFTGRLSLETHPWLEDHAVMDAVLLPGTAFVELALAAAERVGAGGVEELTLVAPLVLDAERALQMTVAGPGEDGRRPVSVYSRPQAGAGDDGDPDWTLHASGMLGAGDAEPRDEGLAAFAAASWPPAGAEEVDVELLYDRLAEAGYDYGPAFQGLRRAYREGDAWFAEVALDGEHESAAAGFRVHPALFDGALHATLLERGAGNGAPVVPFSFSGVRVTRAGASALRVRIETTADAEAGATKVGLQALDESGAPVFAVEALEARPVDLGALKAQAGAGEDSLFAVEWVEVEGSGDGSAARVALLGSDAAADLDAAGIELARHEDLAALEEAVADGAPAPEVVLVRASAAGGPLAGAVHDLTERMLGLLQAWLASESLAEARLVMLTDGALAVGAGESPNLAQAALVGLMRSARSENPGRFGAIDLDRSEASVASLLGALESEEPELALRDGVLYAPRLARAGGLTPPPEAGAWRLAIERTGSLEDLALVPSEAAEIPLSEGQVRVAVRAAGLNFRDVLIALGMYPGEAPLGSEGAGVVVEVGPGVERLALGDRVMGLVGEAFGPHAIADQRTLVPIPAGWSNAEAAAVPAVYLTAYYALVDLAELQRGERLLVHGAAGGVGMAALQLARHLGAEVYATAHRRKWETLRELGLEPERIASSRDLEFHERFLEATGGEGVDVVLDSLTGEFVDASLELLPRGGRFVEIGKADIRDPEQVAAGHEGVRYRAFDLVEAGPERIQEMLVELVKLFESGVLSHPPISTWDVRRAPEAFRHMREGRHVGKIVLSVPQDPNPEGTILITGATGGLGALVARHLAEHGARRLLLTSRRGAAADGAEELVAALAELGCQARVAACDVAEREQVEALLAEIPGEHPLTAVIHAAGILDDGVIGSLDGDRLKRVMAPKVDGAINLHELTKDAELAQFVLFSSIAGTLGSPGQGNYSAANAFLDALAHHRSAAGLPAAALAWGAWERGMGGALSDADRTRMERLGITALSDEEALALLDAASAAAEPLLAPARLDTAALRAQAKAGVLPAILRGLVRAPARRASKGSLARRLAAAPESEWQAIVLELVRSHVASVLGHSSPDSIDPQRSFKELGFDSLSAVELRNRLNQATGLKLPSTLVFDHPTPTAAAEVLRSEVAGVERRERAAPRGPARGDEPIAIVGMSCRYPGGVSSPEELWELVASGRDAIGEFPDDRGWDLDRLFDPDPDEPGTSYTRHGGFLYDAADFDAGFFGIGPSEALAMDPQQRLMLEAAWDAFQSAGIDPASLRETETGVFAGAGQAGYREHVGEAYEAFRLTGTTMSVVSGRLAHMFGLQGPAVTVDTACSSSLVALHLASQSLLRGDCSLALAGGVTVMAEPELLVDFARQRGLAPDGRCKSYGAAADGTGFSDGLGLLVLERLSDARRLGHRVLAVVRGSAVNQDGPSNGLTAPNGPSQERVIRQALANAGLSPADVDAVEGHGTGTTLGDPIEAQALLATYGQERSNGPLRLGSIKSNIGHTSASAGVAGVIKMVEALRHDLLPPTLHCEEPSPHVDWSAGDVRLLAEAEPWEQGERPRRAAVSSFGISGTNAHVILEEAPADAEEAPGERSELPALPFLLSARGEAALRGQAERLHAWVEQRPELEPLDISFTLATARARLERRAAVTGSGREELLEGLGSLSRGEPAAGVTLAEARPGKTAFLFTGQGAQWPGMGAELYEHFPVFREALDAVCSELDRHTDRSLRDLLFAAEGSPEAELLDRTEFTQAALFALEVALHRLFESWALRPDYLIGHSIGELVAAHVAGVLSLADACALVAARGRLMGALPEGGGMLAIKAAEDEVAETLEGFEGRLSVAAVNGPQAVVVSGEAAALDELEPVWSERADTKRLRVSHAFHSHLMEPMLDEFRSVAEGLDYEPPRTEIVSNLSGAVVSDELRDPGYWVRHVREAVRFADGVAELERLGVTRYVELGPDGVLTAMARLAAGEELGEHAAFAPAMRAGHEQVPTLVGCLGALDAAGAELDWEAFFAGRGARVVDLPTYAFQRERYWLEPAGGPGDLSAAGLGTVDHPLLGAALPLPGDRETSFTGQVSLARQPWLRDHAVFDRVLFPGTAFAELLLTAGRELGCGVVEELTLEAPLVLAEGDELTIQVVVAGDDGRGRREVEVYSRGPVDAATNGEGSEWVRHAGGVVSDEASPAGDAVRGLAGEAWPPADAEPVDVASMYDRLADAGFGYGPAFQGVVAAWRRGEETFCEVALDEDAAGFGVHPALLDASFHAVLDSLRAESDGRGVPVPVALRGVRVHRAGASALRVRVEVADDGDAVSLAAVDDSGQPVLELDSVVVRPLDAERLGAAARVGADSLFRCEWVEIALDEDTPPPGRYAVLGRGIELPGDVPDYPDLDALVAAVEQGDDFPEVVLVSAADVVGNGAAPDGDAAARAREGVAGLLSFLQAWLAADARAESRLVLVTRGAMGVAHGEAPDPARAALWGLVRSGLSEHPGRFTLVDLDERADAGAIDWPALLAAGEAQLAVRRGGAYALRLARLHTANALAAPEGVDAWHLDAPRRGTLEDLALVESPRAKEPLGSEEVRIAVRAGGLNFRDVLIALGQYPGDDPIGSEAAGVVLEVGDAVTDLAIGDRVMGPMPGAVGPVAVADRRLVAKVPEGWSWAEAASVPIAFMTAYYGLLDVGALREGQAVLVHAGAGGVGMAAIQIARRVGAEVYATASPAKWEVLRGLGLDEDHIASSRDLEFRDRFLAATGGRGVDVVLNALAREFVDASLELLPRGGRFVELGKADVRDADQVARDHPGVEYRAFDLIPDAGPDRAGELLTEIVGLFEAGVLHHPPIRAWDVRHAPEAFRHLGDGRNVGKVVLTVPRSLDGEGTVLITGGTGDLGGRVARHLAGEHGVRRLLLVSRRGQDAAGAAELVEELRALGADPSVAACDVTDRDEVSALLASIDAEHPLTAVIHTAGVLDDAVIESLTEEQVDRVMRPKADAALVLDELTRETEVAELVLFSSQSGTMGPPGQGNYSAANAFLDALAERRRAQGLPAKSLAWGLWSDASGLAGQLDEADVARLARVGVAVMRDELELFDAARASAEPVVLPTRLDMSALRAAAEAGTLPPLMRDLVRGRPQRERATGRSLEQELAEVPEDERESKVLSIVSEHVASVLGQSSAEAIDPEHKFKELGFDSLSAVELRNRLARVGGQPLPSTLIFDHPSPVALSRYLLSKLSPPPAGDGGETRHADEAEIRHLLASLSVERLREAGLLDPLVRLAGSNGDDGESRRPEQPLAVDELDADELVRMAKGES